MIPAMNPTSAAQQLSIEMNASDPTVSLDTLSGTASQMTAGTASEHTDKTSPAIAAFLVEFGGGSVGLDVGLRRR